MKRVLIREVPNGMGRARVCGTLVLMLHRDVKEIASLDPLIVLMDEFSDADVTTLATVGIVAEEA